MRCIFLAFLLLCGAWRKPVNVTGNGIDLDCGINAAGVSVTAWFYQQAHRHYPVLARLGAPGGTLGPAQHIPHSGRGGPTNIGEHDVRAHVAANGTATVIYSETSTLFAADAPADGAWSQPVMLSPKHGAFDLHAAFNSRGDAVVVWDQGFDAGGGVYAVTRQAGGAWSAPVAVVIATEHSERVISDDVSLAEDGSLVIAYEIAETAGPHVLRDFALYAASAAAPGAAWHLSSPLAGGARQGIPMHAVAAEAEGGAAALVTLVDFPTSHLVSITRVSASADWGAPALFALGSFAFPPYNDWATTFATDAHGHATLIGVDGSLTFQAYTLDIARQAWTGPIALSAPGVMPPIDYLGQYNPWGLGVAPDGSAAVAFFTARRPEAYAESRRGPEDRWFSPVKLLGSAALQPYVRVSAADGGVAAVALGVQRAAYRQVVLSLEK